MTKRTLCLAAIVLIAGISPAWAQQDELAKLRAELVNQQTAIAQLLQRIDELEKKQSLAATKEEVEDEALTQQDSVNSLRETLLGKVNISGYTNIRFDTNVPEEPSAFQLDNLGLILGKQLGRFSVLAEVEMQNAPHHAEPPGAHAEEGPKEEGHKEEGPGEGGAEAPGADISGEGQVAVENAWIEYTHNRYLGIRVGKQLSPQYWWQNRYPNLTYSTALPIHVRQLFPPELTGVTVRGTVSRPVGTSEFGVGYTLYASNNDFEGKVRADLQDGKAWGGRLQLRFPTGGALRRLDVAGDIYRGHTGIPGGELAEDHVIGFEGQLEVSRFLLKGEYARGESEDMIRSGYYVQPAVHLHPDWLTFYRVEELKSPRILRAERRHLAGVNYRPFSQVALKLEYYRSVPLTVSFIKSEEERKPFNGFATAAVFFF